MSHHVLIGDTFEFVHIGALIAEFAITEAVATVAFVLPLSGIFGKRHETAFARRPRSGCIHSEVVTFHASSIVCSQKKERVSFCLIFLDVDTPRYTLVERYILC